MELQKIVKQYRIERLFHSITNFKNTLNKGLVADGGWQPGLSRDDQRIFGGSACPYQVAPAHVPGPALTASRSPGRESPAVS